MVASQAIGISIMMSIHPPPDDYDSDDDYTIYCCAFTWMPSHTYIHLSHIDDDFFAVTFCVEDIYSKYMRIFFGLQNGRAAR